MLLVFCSASSRCSPYCSILSGRKETWRRTLTSYQLWYISCTLKLKEASLEHILWTNHFHLHQIQHHIVPQVKGGVQSIRFAFDHVLRCGGLELLITHHDDYSAIIQATTISSTRHLNVFPRG